MGRINIDLDLFCAGCSKALEIEDSAGHHVLVKPCRHCTQTAREQTAKKIKEDAKVSSSTQKQRDKLEQWKREEKEQEKELENITGPGAAQAVAETTEGGGEDGGNKGGFDE